ncbi:Carbon catabolite repressor protein 4 homolog 1 [Geodia barretti]|uniref:Carbon catabolite repressor protein 4 homolog 1 n=1 Tax=Geodia barretti TaxID=519541 RepID=A0AA35RGQ3_GEOBA|nr:Carbon catabolite repressor protein 4 homolog 1 [Geodia barretti]
MSSLVLDEYDVRRQRRARSEQGPRQRSKRTRERMERRGERQTELGGSVCGGPGSGSPRIFPQTSWERKRSGTVAFFTARSHAQLVFRSAVVSGKRTRLCTTTAFSTTSLCSYSLPQCSTPTPQFSTRHPSPRHPSTLPRHPTPHGRGNPLLQRPWETINEPEQVGQTLPTILMVMTYNVLAQSLIDKNMHLYRNTGALYWESRRQLLLRELREARADIVCLQEVEEEHYHNWFLPNMSSLAFSGDSAGCG